MSMAALHLGSWDICYFPRQLALGVPKIKCALHGKPKMGAVAAELSKPHRHLRRNRRLFGQDAVQMLARDAKLFRDCSHAFVDRRENVIAEDGAGMGWAAFLHRKNVTGLVTAGNVAGRGGAIAVSAEVLP